MQHFGNVKITEIHVSNKKMEWENTHMPKKPLLDVQAFLIKFLCLKEALLSIVF